MLPVKTSMTPSKENNAGVGAPTLHAAENLHVTYSQLAPLSADPPHSWIQLTLNCVVEQNLLLGKNPHVSGPHS